MPAPDAFTRVTIAGRETPLLLRSVGPATTEQRVRDFEARLGRTLPASYREFILRYNGGDPLCGDICAYDDAGQIAHVGPQIESFFSLDAPHEHTAITTPADHVWPQPPHLLPIASDPFGNLFALDLRLESPEVVFLDHEDRDTTIVDPLSVVTNDFDELLRFIKPADVYQRECDAEAIEAAGRLARERELIKRGRMPSWFTAGATAPEVVNRVPALVDRFRSLCLAIHDAQQSKPSADAVELTLLFLDITAWVRTAQRVIPPVYVPAVDDVVDRWTRSAEVDVAVVYARVSAARWLDDRESRGWVRKDGPIVRVTDAGIDAIVSALATFAPPAE
jgi:cell wall assembly regulator SMI1